MLHNYKMATVQVSKVEPVIPVSNILKNVLHKIYSSLLFSPCIPLPISTCIKFAEISSALDNMYRAPVSHVPAFGISLYLLYNITVSHVSCPATWS